jgi:transcriptional regulator with XRE-family HTH domain
MYASANFSDYAPAYMFPVMDVREKLTWLIDTNAWTQTELADRLGTTQPTVNRWLNGADPRGSTREKINELYEAVHNGVEDAQVGMVRLSGKIGADPSGTVLFAESDELDEWVPIPPGGSQKDSALEVAGHSMRGVADDGAIIYYSSPRTPSDDYLGEVVVCEVETGERLVKRMLRGSRRGLYDLESVNGDTRRDEKLHWIAEITSIVPPRQARRLLRR